MFGFLKGGYKKNSEKQQYCKKDQRKNQHFIDLVIEKKRFENSQLGIYLRGGGFWSSWSWEEEEELFLTRDWDWCEVGANQSDQQLRADDCLGD